MVALQLMALALLLGAVLAPSPSEQASVEVAAVREELPRIGVQHRLLRGRLRYIPPPPPHRSTYLRSMDQVEELQFDQILDHFNPTNKKTWQQRYFSRSDLYEDGGPVFIFIGGESEESKHTLMDFGVFMTYLAEGLMAKTYVLEHRFYGQSRPFPDLSTANLQYLSADQALADLAYFIEYLKKKGEISEGQKVAVFGGSYPGNLAAWARLKYPHLVHAAISSSAPVHAKADFVEYMEVVGRSLVKVAGQFCFDNVKKATDRIVQLLKTTDGYKTVKDTFHVGTELMDKLDLDVFFEKLSSPFAGAVQYNRDVPKSPYNIKYICSFMSGDNLTPDEAMNKLASLVLGPDASSDKIFDWSYKSSIKDTQDTKYGDSMRQWLYQTCTEFGYFQTFTGAKTPFPQGFNDIDYDYQICKDIFGSDFDKDMVSSGVERSNLVFGDWKPDVTKVMFVNGNVDPWHALGVLEDVSPDAPAILIDGGSHCADMNYPSGYGEAQEITDAHDKVHHFLRTSLYDAPNGDPAEV